MDLNIFEKDFYIRFSKITELNTLLVLGILLILIHIPTGITYNYPFLYTLASISFVLTILWHHVLIRRIDKSYINFVEAFFNLLFITLLIYNTGQGYSIFILLYMLPVLSSMGSSKLYHNIIILAGVEAILLMLYFTGYAHVTMAFTSFYMLMFFLVDMKSIATRTLITKAEQAAAVRQARIVELTDANKYKDEFVYLTTHELKTPITVIRGYIDLLMQDKENHFSDKSRDVLTRLVNHTNCLAVIVEELLDVSRIETGKVNVNIATFDLDELIMNVIDDLKVNAAQKGVVLKYANHDGIKLATDKDRLREVLINLIDNAIKYSKQNGVVVLSSRLNGKKVEISVKDSGIGIPIEDQPKIFQKFFRAKNVYQFATQGSGLGLYIVYRLVDLLRGYVQFSSEENKGTTFRIQLPQN